MRPIVINSCVDSELNRLLAESGALMLDVFAPFIAPLEQELGAPRQPRVGQAHGMVDFDTYHRRINAMNYALTHDDGMRVDYARRRPDPGRRVARRQDADLRVPGAALRHPRGQLSADRGRPGVTIACRRACAPYRNKLFGLTIDPIRLQQIRQERRPNSRYSQLDTCKREVAAAETMFQVERIPVLSTTHASIEEIASRVLTTLGINREMF